MEATGGYEKDLLYALCNKGFAVHRANSRKVKNFIRSFGNDSKTDSLDAKALATYGEERCSRLELFAPQSGAEQTLYALVQRRNDLKKMLVAEKNRAKSPTIQKVRKSCEALVLVLSKQIENLSLDIDKLIDQNTELVEKKKELKSIPGIGQSHS